MYFLQSGLKTLCRTPHPTTAPHLDKPNSKQFIFLTAHKMSQLRFTVSIGQTEIQRIYTMVIVYCGVWPKALDLVLNLNISEEVCITCAWHLSSTTVCTETITRELWVGLSESTKGLEHPWVSVKEKKLQLNESLVADAFQTLREDINRLSRETGILWKLLHASSIRHNTAV